jgi:cytochrome c oxidase assembly protein subunit 15
MNSIQAVPVNPVNPHLAVAPQGLRRFSKFLCVVVAFLIFLGGHVKSNEAGLAVPDWPTSFGYNMFTFPVSYWVGGIYHEHVHRLVASVVGILTLALLVWTLFSESRRWMRVLTAAALGMVIIQGLMGGLTVIHQLPVWISSIHGTLAQIFFCVVIAIAYGHSNEWRSHRYVAVVSEDRSKSRFKIAARVFVMVVLAQLIFGNLMRHSEAGLAVPDFPTMGGSLIPSFNADTLERINQMRATMQLPAVTFLQIELHMVHRLWAFVVLGAAIWLGIAMRRVTQLAPQVRSTVRVVELAVAFQMALGIWVVLSQRSPLSATLHLLLGALILGSSVLLNLRLGRLSR